MDKAITTTFMIIVSIIVSVMVFNFVYPAAVSSSDSLNAMRGRIVITSVQSIASVPGVEPTQQPQLVGKNGQLQPVMAGQTDGDPVAVDPPQPEQHQQATHGAAGSDTRL